MSNYSNVAAVAAAPPALARTRMLATAALIAAACLWLALLIMERLLPAHSTLLNILSFAAEAGVVGGLADWYAITVLFRNPFGRLPLPRILQEHTAIIPRNKARIAESIGRFAQENFLSPEVVRRALRETDVSLTFGQWLSDERNVRRVGRFIQRNGPRLLQVFESKAMEDFIQQNAVEWIKVTPMNRTAAELLRAVLENDFHHEALQLCLDAANRWVKENPDKAHALAKRIFQELGVGGLARGASWIGIDVQQRIIDTFVVQVAQLLQTREHPWRQALEAAASDLMLDFKEDSISSAKLNAVKNTLANSPAVVDFFSSAVIILRDAVKQDLEARDSGLIANVREMLMRLGEQLQENAQVRAELNREIEEAAVVFATDYANAVILYVSKQIHRWDTSEMIAKLETEVGGDLHMIRVNGVVMGAVIGLLLGITRAVIETVPF